MVSLGPLDGTVDVVATSISEDGSIIAGYGSDLSTPFWQAFRWTSENGMTILGDLPGGVDVYTVARGVSADGSSIVGTGGSANGSEAFRWTEAEGIVGLGDIPTGNFGSGAYAISGDGLTVVGFGRAAGETFPAARWTSTGIDVLTVGTDAYATGVSHDGSVIAGYYRSGTPFVWTETGGLVSLEALPIANLALTSKVAVSGDGRVVVDDSRTRAFYWTDEGGMQNLNTLLALYGVNLSGWVLRDAAGVSFDGRVIVGTGTRNGNYEAYIVHLPLPGSVGACCHGTACTITTESDCVAAGGMYGGAWSFCTTGSVGNPVACCRANFDQLNGVTNVDVFVFLAAWFADEPRADFDSSGEVGVPDIFAFLSAWYGGC
jgi:uncharacterized membrane protein